MEEIKLPENEVVIYIVECPHCLKAHTVLLIDADNHWLASHGDPEGISEEEIIKLAKKSFHTVSVRHLGKRGHN